VLPFLLGAVLARAQLGVLRLDLLAWGTLGVVLTMLATYYAGEYWDYAEDTIAGQLGTSRFSGGSQVLQHARLSRRTPLFASWASALLALAVGLVLQVRYHTGPWTLALVVLGLLGGFFYSTRPVRWVSRGWGELWIAFCYGWLPVAAGYYLQSGDMASVVHWVAVPIGLSIFNVILLNEFPDYPADLAAGKRNLAVRLGLERTAWIYVLVAIAGWAGMGVAIRKGMPLRALWLYVPIMLLSLALILSMLRERWRDRTALEIMCAANLAVNLGTTAACILAFLG
jgi:1,4-dihydroxy-2-naphthoate octaprenyltransferase